MDIKAGRHGSGAPAATFMQGLGSTNVMGLDTKIDATPDKLNFVVYGTMNFNFSDNASYECSDFRIAMSDVAIRAADEVEDWHFA